MLGTNANVLDEGADDAAIGSNFSLELPGDGSIIFDAQPITFDYSESAAQEEFGTPQFARTLHDLVSANAYRLRRLVGKIFAHTVRDGGDDYAAVPALVDYASGFMVCRTDESGNAVTDFTHVNPLHMDSANDPWIWRRRWILSTSPHSPTWNYYAAVGPTSQVLAKYPNSTEQLGSVLDGPHIDAKTARIIHQEERLYWVNAARTLGYTLGSPGDLEPVYLHGLLDCRAVASLKFGSGNKKNASR